MSFVHKSILNKDKSRTYRYGLKIDHKFLSTH